MFLLWCEILGYFGVRLIECFGVAPFGGFVRYFDIVVWFLGGVTDCYILWLS